MSNKNKHTSDEQLVKEIITRYGEVIDLKKNPHLMIEVLRHFSSGQVAELPDGGVSVAGVGTPPGPKREHFPEGNVVENAEIMKEVLKLSKQIQLITNHLQINQ